MKTDVLIDLLSRDPRPGPSPGRLLVQILPVALVLSAMGMPVTLGLRPDLDSIAQPFVALKSLAALAAAGAALWLGLRLTTPAASARRPAQALALVPAVLVLAVVMTLVGTVPESWSMQFTGKTIMGCLVSIPVLALVPLAAILWAFRQGAPLEPVRAGAIAGLAAGASAAAIYSLYCMEDSPLFYAVWYVVAVLIVTALGAVLGARLLRW